MKISLAAAILGAGILFGGSAFAEAPAGAIAQCKDGTYFTGTSHKGACKGHQGVKEWLDKDKSATASTTTGSDSSSSSKSKSKTSKSTTSTGAAAATGAAASTGASAASNAAAAPAAAPAATPAPAPSMAGPTPASTTTSKKPPTPSSEIAQKAGGGAGQVWVNSESKVYHCQGDQWYGKTKQGSYMTEAAAKAAGNHAAHGKDCSG